MTSIPDASTKKSHKRQQSFDIKDDSKQNTFPKQKDEEKLDPPKKKQKIEANTSEISHKTILLEEDTENGEFLLVRSSDGSKSCQIFLRDQLPEESVDECWHFL